MHRNIVLLTEHFPPDCGGTPRWFYNLYSRLTNCKVIVITKRGTLSKAPNLLLMPVAWKLQSWTFLDWRNWLAYLQLITYTWQVVRKTGADIIHVGRCIPEGIISWFLKRFTHVPYCTFVHGEDIEIAWQCREYYHLVKHVLRDADMIVANSRFSRNLLIRKWRIPSARVTILYPGVDADAFRPVSSGLACSRPFTILCVGRFQRRKGQDILIRAVSSLRKHLPDLRCILAGAGEDREYLLTLIHKLNAQSYIQCVEHPTDSELLRLYAEADIVTLPNRDIDGDCEGFGIVLLEAQACKKPVLCGNSGGTRETLLPGRSGMIVDCTSPTSLAQAILSLYNRRNHLPNMGALGRHWIERHLDWKALIPKARVLLKIS